MTTLTTHASATSLDTSSEGFKFANPTVLDFACRIGNPTSNRFTNVDDYADYENRFVDALRRHVKVVASRCLLDNPTKYAQAVADLVDSTAGVVLTRSSARLTWLLVEYANYMPSPDCQFVDDTYGFDLTGCHAWLAPDGVVVVDIVTTLTATRLYPEPDHELVMAASSAARLSFGSRLFGVRLIVLDDPNESALFTPPGVSVPLLSSVLNPLALPGFGGGAL